MEHTKQENGFLFATEDAAAKVEKNMPDEVELYVLSEFFKVFGDSTRLRILSALGTPDASELCVGDLALLLGVTPSAVSHQLKTLKSARLVRSRRVGKTVFYSLADSHVHTIINSGLEHVNE